MEEKEEKFPAQWALDILEPTLVDQSNSILKYYTVPPAMICGPLGVLAYNYTTSKPLYCSKLINYIILFYYYIILEITNLVIIVIQSAQRLFSTIFRNDSK